MNMLINYNLIWEHCIARAGYWDCLYSLIVNRLLYDIYMRQAQRRLMTQYAIFNWKLLVLLLNIRIHFTNNDNDNGNDNGNGNIKLNGYRYNLLTYRHLPRCINFVSILSLALQVIVSLTSSANQCPLVSSSRSCYFNHYYYCYCNFFSFFSFFSFFDILTLLTPFNTS